MAISKQKISHLQVTNLKNIKNLELSFLDKPVTAILGPNGNGKSTILHALACAFQPNTTANPVDGEINPGENYKFSKWFPPNPDAQWQGSELHITHSYQDGAQIHENIMRKYSKRTDRWSPRYEDRPKRDIFYIGVDKCVPLIETENRTSRVNYATDRIQQAVIDTILSKASYILNKRYTAYTKNTTNAGKWFIGVAIEGLNYSALSMSAGEQKTFLILEKVFRAPKHALILIDEIDLLLHDIALKRLTEVISERAADKSLQIIFTTHRESITELSDTINIRHIINRPEKTLCFNETKPDAINRLTGAQPRPLEIFVEDSLTFALVSKIAAQLKLSKYLSIQVYGAAVNCFTAVGGLILGGDTCENSLFILDGDVYSSEHEKEDRIKQVLTGNDQIAIERRQLALSKIRQFKLPAETKPEQFLHQIICRIEKHNQEEFNEIIEVARDINAVNNSHKYIGNIISTLGWELHVGLSKIVDLFATSNEWADYIEPIREWLIERAGHILEADLDPD